METREALGRKICGALLSNGYKTAVYAPFAAEAAKTALDMVPDGATVGVPGSVTVRQLGLIEKLEGKKCSVYHHWDPSLTPDKRAERLKNEIYADWFITSSNAVTYDGKMVNIDGTGNRVSAMAWSTGKLLYIVSVNKAEPDVERALARVRNSATAPNALRLGTTLPPCTKTGHCVDCDSPDRYCRAVLIIERAPLGREVHAIIVGENLGY
jgi:hypothetical protein